ncbi:MAG: hypothetical protein ABIQ95_12790 [Bdellovibrionia bacterium]
MVTRKFLNPKGTLFLVLMLALAGCKDLPSAGNYRGNITVSHSNTITELDKKPVEVALTYGHHHLTVTISDPETHSILMQPWLVSKKHKDTIELSIPDDAGLEGKTLLLKKVNAGAGKCYQSHSAPSELATESSAEVASLCFDPDNFTLNIQGPKLELIHLYGTQFKPARELKFEAPRTLTVSQGVKVILDKNYDVQEAKQSLLRANESARRSYLNLLPHTSVGGAIMVAAVIFGEFWEINRPINDFVSFIFPGRWIKAKAMTWQARAERVANTLFQINMGTSVQTQTIAFRAHRELRDQLQILQAQLSDVLKTAQGLSSQNRIEPNSILTIEIALSDLNVNVWLAQNQFMQDKISLSKTFGFENPETVEDMLLEAETTPLEQILPLSDADLLNEKNRYAELAVGNSFELRQLDYLHRAAELNAKNVYLNWLDVFATMDLGFNLIADKRLAKSMIKSVEIKTEKTRQALIAKAYNLLRDRNLLRLSFDVLDVSLAGRRERLNLLIDKLNKFAGSTDSAEKLTVQASDIRGSVRDVASGMAGYYSTKATVLIDQAALDRLALQGVYDKFLPHLEGTESPTN